MQISKQVIEQLFKIDDVVNSGGGRSSFSILEISDEFVRIQSTKAQASTQLGYDKLSVVIDSFQKVDPHQIEKTVRTLLETFGLNETRNESYLYGFAREYIDRIVKGSLGAVFHSAYERRLDQDIDESGRLTPSERAQRLNNAPRFAEQIATLTTTFKRNPDVIAEVLFRADGHCGECKKEAPFTRRSNGTPYLEVHHRKPLAEHGEDTVENAVALCPNCHRMAHYGGSPV